MKKLINSVMFSILLFISALALAHPPRDIVITFDSNTKVLKAVIVHDVMNPNIHYIKKVEVGLNGKQIIEQDFTLQPNMQNQTVMYIIPDAKLGDKIYVEGHCSIVGSLRKEITIK